jgi:hypothetical protein
VEKYPALKDKVYFKVFPHFGKNWRVPPIYTDVLEGWTCTDGETFSIKE